MDKTIKKTTPIFLKDLGYSYANASSKTKSRYWLVLCQVCNAEFKTMANSIKRGKIKSCKSCAMTRHGGRKSKLYDVWNTMKARCYNPNNKSFVDYGKRNIHICDEWRIDFAIFQTWALANGYKDSLTLERKNNDKDYTPHNCKWTTRIVQARNTRRIRKNNTSGYRGVWYNKSAQKWVASITVNYRRIHLGYFDLPIDGATAYDSYIICHKLEHTKNFTI